MSPKGDSQQILVKYASFSARLVEAAELAGFNSARLAATVGVTRGTMARYWHGERLLPADLLFRIADILAINPRWLITGAGQLAPPLEPDPYTASDEERLLDAFRRLSPEQRNHVTQNAQMLATPHTLHSPRTRYKAEGD
jgi:transcriptional regulator with XRE-family HTH domain